MSKRREFFVCKGCNSKFPRPEVKSWYCSVECQFWSNVNKTDSCWLWNAGGHKFGYGEFRSHGKLIRAHRFSYELHNGEIKNNMSVLHTCDNPKCVNPAHLYLGTQVENCRDTALRNRVGGRKLKPYDVIDIKNRLSKNETCASISKSYKVTQECINLIKLGKTWNHLR